ncbi:hypothetical protein YQE_09515, partial [Dendroctonus ponderosae]
MGVDISELSPKLFYERKFSTSRVSYGIFEIFRDGMGHLAHLLLGDNQLSAIPYQALQPLRTLKTLDLSYNHINKMSPVSE